MMISFDLVLMQTRGVSSTNSGIILWAIIKLGKFLGLINGLFNVSMMEVFLRRSRLRLN